MPFCARWVLVAVLTFALFYLSAREMSLGQLLAACFASVVRSFWELPFHIQTKNLLDKISGNWTGDANLSNTKRFDDLLGGSWWDSWVL